MALFVWDKPVLTLHRDRKQQPEREPFAVVKAKKITITKSENKEIEGTLQDFFALRAILTIYLQRKEKVTGTLRVGLMIETMTLPKPSDA